MERELWAARKDACCPFSPLTTNARFDSECKRWNLEHVVLDLFSHFTMGNIRWSLSAHVQCSLSRSTFCIDALVFPFPQLFDHGHSGRSRGFRHSGGRAATHQVLGSCAILEQRVGRHSRSTTAAASGRRHACGTAAPISPRTTRPRSTQRRHEVA